MTRPEDRWVLALDALEAHVVALHAAPHEAETAPEVVPPADLGPVPRSLVPRATALLHECRSLEEGLAREMSRVSDQLERGRQIPSEHRSTSLFLDQSV